MNAIRCPQCAAVNSLSAPDCRQCQFSFRDLPPTAFVSAPAGEVYQSQNADSPFIAPVDNETGRKAFLWYRVYCGVMVAIYLAVMGLGIAFIVIQPETTEQSPAEVLILGTINAVLGAIFFPIFAVALFLPRKSWNWIVGIVMMAIGMTSCCFLPFLIPLLIYWLKPETKAYFGRN